MLDSSIVLSWCLQDGTDPIAEQAMRRVTEQGAIVPGIRWCELRNALVVNKRRGRISSADTAATLADLRQLRILIGQAHDEGAVVALARGHQHSAYGAAYIEVALRHTLPIASLNKGLRQAAAALGVTTLG